jgi:hypothetical protein
MAGMSWKEIEIEKTRFSETSAQIYTIVHVVRDIYRENVNSEATYVFPRCALLFVK